MKNIKSYDIGDYTLEEIAALAQKYLDTREKQDSYYQESKDELSRKALERYYAKKALEMK